MTSKVFLALRVPADPMRAFKVFTQEIASWWQPSGLFRVSDTGDGSQGRHVTGYVSDALEELKSNSFPAGGDFPADELARDIHGKQCLGDPGSIALLRQKMQILNATIQHIDGMDDSQLADVRYFRLNGAASEILGRQPTTPERKSTCWTPPFFVRLYSSLTLFYLTGEPGRCPLSVAL
jgi:hypothetical protein